MYGTFHLSNVHLLEFSSSSSFLLGMNTRPPMMGSGPHRGGGGGVHSRSQTMPEMQVGSWPPHPPDQMLMMGGWGNNSYSHQQQAMMMMGSHPAAMMMGFQGRVGNKNPLKKTKQKTTLKNPLKMFFFDFWGFFKNFLFFMKTIQTFLF